jgi:carboxypeptidase-like protein
MFVLAQTKGNVRDEATGKPIPYANIWIERSPGATSSDEAGNFAIAAKETDTVSFSAIGYETKKAVASAIANLALKGITYSLEAVTVVRPKRTIEAKLGGYDKSAIDLYYAIGNHPYLYARYFAISDDFSKTPFLKELVLVTKSAVKDAKFNVHFLEVNPDGSPGPEIGTTNIIGTARKGKRETNIDLTRYKLRLPENGFFVALEALILPENQYTENGHTFHAPIFGTLKTETNNSWGFRDEHSWGKFQKVSAERIQKYYDDFKKATGKDAPPFDDRHVEFAMELTLTN